VNDSAHTHATSNGQARLQRAGESGEGKRELHELWAIGEAQVVRFSGLEEFCGLPLASMALAYRASFVDISNAVESKVIERGNVPDIVTADVVRIEHEEHDSIGFFAKGNSENRVGELVATNHHRGAMRVKVSSQQLC
jgi:hypothetical protein